MYLCAFSLDTCVCINVCTSPHMHYVCVPITHMHICMHMYTYAWVCAFLYACVSTYVHVYVCEHVHMHMYVLFLQTYGIARKTIPFPSLIFITLCNFREI